MYAYIYIYTYIYVYIYTSIFISGSIKDGRELAKALLDEKQKRRTRDYWRAPRSYGSDQVGP